MTLEEKQELIKSATSEEELEARMKEIAEDEKEEVVTEEVKEEKEEVKEEVKEEITPEEERSLLKDSTNIEQRNINVQVQTIERKGEFKMEEKMELRNSKEYIDAYAEYIKGNDKELRALLTTNATDPTASILGTVAVPDFVYDIVKTAWEKDDIMSLVRKIEVDGNMKVNFEASAGAAVIHKEGAAAIDEESLVLGIVTLTPVSIKKWVSISDEVYDMRGEAFLRYIYDELTYRIVKKTADTLIAKIAALPQSLSANEEGIYDTVSANKVTSAPALDTIIKAVANLSDEAADYTIVMNKLTYANFKAVQLAANYPADIFDNIRVRFNNTLPAYDAANNGAVYAIVGDFDHGALANYPNGRNVDIKFDDKTLMTSDLIRILGRQYVGAEAVADKAFTLIAKPGSSSI